MSRATTTERVSRRHGPTEPKAVASGAVTADGVGGERSAGEERDRDEAAPAVSPSGGGTVAVVGGSEDGADGGRRGRVARRREPASVRSEPGERGAAVDGAGQDATDRRNGVGEDAAPRRAREVSVQARRSVRRSVAVVLGALTLVFGALAVGFGLAWANLQSSQDARHQVAAVSRAFVLDLTNLTPATVDTRINDLLAASTGQFLSQANAFFANGIRQQLIKARPTEQGQVRTLAVESVGQGRAQVFAVVDDSYTNPALQAKGQAEQTDVLRLELGLSSTAHGWRVATVTVVGGAVPGVLGSPSGSSAGSGA